MDTRERDLLIGQLHEEILRSLKEALRMSAAWNARSTTLKMQYGDDTHQLYIAKRDDLRLKEYMSGYVWHRDNSSWANGMIQMLMNEEVSQIARVPAQR